MSPALAAALATVAAAAPEDSSDWWLIGSTAMRLCGIAAAEPQDVDLLAGRETALAFLARLGVAAEPAAAPPAGARFASDPFVRVRRPGALDIEVMGDLRVRDGRGWQWVRLATRRPVAVAGGRVFIAEPAEQAALMRLFGRSKDRAKAALIERALADGQTA